MGGPMLFAKFSKSLVRHQINKRKRRHLQRLLKLCRSSLNGAMKRLTRLNRIRETIHRLMVVLVLQLMGMEPKARARKKASHLRKRGQERAKKVAKRKVAKGLKQKMREVV